MCLVASQDAIGPTTGRNFYDLRCDDCGATWVGSDGETCWWCIKRHQHVLDEQRELVLTPPEVERDDENYDKKMGAWVQRMERAVEAGIITEPDAQRAVDRVVSSGGA